jgi:hypothetical protein
VWVRSPAHGGVEDPFHELHLSPILRSSRAKARPFISTTTVLKEILLPAGVLDCDPDLPRFARLFDRGHTCDWGTCDWFCVKVLGPLVEQQAEACARAISDS